MQSKEKNFFSHSIRSGVSPTGPEFAFFQKVIRWLLTIIMLISSLKVEGQTAKQFFQEHDFNKALEEYLKLYEKDKSNIEYNYNIALCYLLTNNDKTKAIPFLEFITKTNSFTNEVWFELGNAYRFAYKFDEAIKHFEKYKSLARGDDLAKVEKKIEECNNAREMVKKPLDVTFDNLGKEINSEYPDYYPFVPSNESFLAYTTRRKGSAETIGYEGYYTCDIYISRVKAGVFTKAKSISPTINTVEDEQLVGLSPDGKTILVYLESVDEYGDLYVSTTKGKNFQAPEPLDESISSIALETEGHISNDNNIIYFASNRSGGLGGTDIYFSKRLPTGEYAKPVNLGPNINTKYDEAFPRITDDGKTLYFSSEGHNSIGGFDIFTSVWNEEKQDWDPPVNFGYPINTPEDNMNFALSVNGRDGYISAYRKGGFGDLDIYKVTFNSVDDKQTIFRGRILDADSLPILASSRIGLVDANEVEIANFTPNQKNAKFVMSISPGKYVLNVDVDGFPPYTEKLTVLGKSDFKEIIEKNFFMFKPGESRVKGKKVVETKKPVPGKKQGKKPSGQPDNSKSIKKETIVKGTPPQDQKAPSKEIPKTNKSSSDPVPKTKKNEMEKKQPEKTTTPLVKPKG